MPHFTCVWLDKHKYCAFLSGYKIPITILIIYNKVCLFVFYVPSTARSFRDGTPIYCPLRKTWSSVNTPFPPGIEPRTVAWQSITLPLRHASSHDKEATIRTQTFDTAVSACCLPPGRSGRVGCLPRPPHTCGSGSPCGWPPPGSRAPAPACRRSPPDVCGLGCSSAARCQSSSKRFKMYESQQRCLHNKS